MWMIILFVLLIYSFVRGTFEDEPVTRKSLIIIPGYALVMMICSLAEEDFNHKLLLTVLLLAVGILIGLFQASRVSVTDAHEQDPDRKSVV